MRRKYGLRSIILFLSICVSVISACSCVLLIAGDYYTAWNKVEIYTNELQGWEACRQTEPSYFESSTEAVNTCISNLEEAKNNLWVKYPKNKIIPLFVLAGLVSAIIGYMAVRFFWYCGLGIYKIIEWVKLCIENKGFRIPRFYIPRFRIPRFCIRKGKKKKDIFHEVEHLEYQMYKPVDEKDMAREEELIHQVEMLRDEVFSVGSNIDKLSHTDEDYN